MLQSIGMTGSQLTKMLCLEGLYYAPVSYTHLDVYKRQAVFCSKPRGIFILGDQCFGRYCFH